MTWRLVLLVGVAVGGASCTALVDAFTACDTGTDCERGYACHTDHRCYPACRAGGCEGDAVCVDRACVPRDRVGGSSGPPPASSWEGSSSQEWPSSSLTESSSGPGSTSVGASSSGPLPSSSGVRPSSVGATSTAPPSSAAPPSSSGVSSSGPVVDTCNGVDDDQDGRTDEDDMAVESGSPVILSTDSPYTRAPVAASSRGFFVAFGAYCVEDDNFSDIMVNHIDTDGTVTVNTRPCAAVLGRRAYTSQDRASHLPALSSSGTDTAVLAWTEQVGSQSIEMMVADLVLGGVSLSVLGPVSAGGMNSGYGATLAWGGVAMGPTAYLAGRTQGVSANERARARLVTHDGPNQLVVGDDRELGPSTEGEVAVARVGSSYAAAWVDGQSVMVRFLDAQGQPSGPGPLALARPAVPFYLQVVAVSDSRVVVAWAEAATNLGYPAEAIRLAAASVGDAHLTLVGGGFVTPEEEGHFALESAGGGELLVAVNDKAQGKLILYRVNVTTGTVCQPGVDIWDGAVGPVGMAVRGHRGLLAYLRPLGSGSQQYQVVAVRLRRSGT